MGQLCTFTGSTVLDEPLASSWELCLRCLSRYTGLSSIAKKSFHLLEESAKRLLPGVPSYGKVGAHARLQRDYETDEDAGS